MRGKMKKSAAEKPSTTFLSNQEEPKKHKPMTASASQISKITPNVPGVAQRLFVQRFPKNKKEDNGFMSGPEHVERAKSG